MHRLIKIRIVRDLEHLEERVRRWRDTVFDPEEPGIRFRPAVDFYETSHGLVLRMEAAGMAVDDLSLVLAGQELIIRGRRLPLPPEGLVRFFHLEIGFGSFERIFSLPIPIDPQGVQAQCTDGILEVRLPRQAPQIKKISVKETPA